jgi:hypothetical protein
VSESNMRIEVGEWRQGPRRPEHVRLIIASRAGAT